MSFCGSKFDALSVEAGVLANDCYVDVLNIIPHALFLLISITLLLVWSHSVFAKINLTTWVHYQGHTARWIITLTLICVNAVEIAEGVMSDALDPDSTNFHVFIPQCFAMIGTVLSIVYYHNVEMWNSPKFLILLMLYWIGSLTCKVLKLLSLSHNTDGQIELADLRLWVTIISVILYGLLLLVEINLLRLQHYAFFKEAQLLNPPDELAETRYIYSYVNFLSKVTFWWTIGLLIEGYKHIMDLQRLGPLPKTEHANCNVAILHHMFEEEKVKSQSQSKHPSLARSYLKAFWPMLGLAAVCRLCGDLLAFVGPWCIENIVDYAYLVKTLQPSTNITNVTTVHPYVHVGQFFSNGYVLAFILLVANILQKSFLQKHHFLVIRQGIRMRNAIQGMVFEKALSLSTVMLSSGKMSIGQIINHVSTDAYFLLYLFFFIHYVWAMPIQIIYVQGHIRFILYLASMIDRCCLLQPVYLQPVTVQYQSQVSYMDKCLTPVLTWKLIEKPIQMAVAFVLLYLKLGYSAVIGGSVVVVVLPFQYLIGSALSRMQKKVLMCSDERMKRSNELIHGIKLLKLFAWERLFCRGVETVRKKEVKFLVIHAVLLALMDFITVGTPIAGMMVTFSMYSVLEDKPLTAGKVFSTVALFNVLFLPLLTLTLVMNSIVNARVSGKRLVPYLLAPEVDGLNLPTGSHPHEDDEEIRLDLGVRYHPGSGRVRTSISSGRCNSGVNSLHNSHSSLTGSVSHHSSRSSGVPSDMSGGHLSVAAHRMRKYSAPSRMVSHTGPCSPTHQSGGGLGRRHGSGTQVPGKSAEPKESQLHGPKRSQNKSEQSSSSSIEKCGVAFSEYSDLLHPGSRSLSKEDIQIQEKVATVEICNSVEIKGGNFSWSVDTEDLCLRNIDLKVPIGKLTVIVGQVGSGKSSLLSAMLREMVTVSGTVEWCSGTRIAYVAQRPWLLNASFRDNILFGQPFLWKKYKHVINACALHPDIQMLPAGDMTEIGEKGINLSGGQKQRVSIARALYSGANTILLDDPLSALDSHVGKHVFDAAIVRRLVHKRRTVILVTHNIQYLCQANQVVVMKDGEIQHQGKLGQIKTASPDLYETWRVSLRDAKKREKEESKAKPVDNITVDQSDCSKSGHLTNQLTSQSQDMPRCSSAQSHLSVGLFELASGQRASKLSVMTEDSDDPEPVGETGKLIEEEGREQGPVATAVYLSYLRAYSIPLAVGVFLLILVKHGVMVAADFWLSIWAGASTVYALNNTRGVISQDIPKADWDYYLHVYVALCMCGIGLALFTSVIQELTSVWAAAVIHLKILRNLVGTPIRFFDTTPSGRILNRLSADTATIDLRMGQTLMLLLKSGFLCLAGIIVNTITTAYFLVAMVPLSIVYVVMQRFYLATTRQLQRLESVTKSPIISHFSETLNGLQTIRAYGVQLLFLNKALSTIDTNTVAFLYLHTINRFMGVFLDYMGSVLVFVAAIASLTAALNGQTDPAFIGIAIAYTLFMCDSLNWFVRNAAELALQMNAVERVKEYSETPTEPYTNPGYVQLDATWPVCGKVEFERVSVRYDDILDPVLKSVSFTIHGGETVGLCGRTGSGKSTLALSLFRMVDICEGTIRIDEEDISKVPLTTLRSSITIIPQDPFLFSGSVRYNLDPEGKYDDEKIWQALEMSQMKKTILGMAEKLDTVITEGGENFSVGQRQLFCFARALLRNCKILVMDEATASIDLATDELIQQVIATAFSDKTVITVAHRISTIKNYDRVMVLEEGEVAEFDKPATLMDNPDNLFAKLAKETKL